MLKLRKISEITATLPFTEFDFMQKYVENLELPKSAQKVLKIKEY